MSFEDYLNLFVNEATKLGADDAIALIREQKVNTIRYANNQITVVYHNDILTLSGFIGIERKIATGTIENLTAENIKEFASKLVKIAKLSKPLESYVNLPKGPFEYPERGGIDKRIKEADVELIEIVKRAISSSLDAGAKRSAGILYSMTSKEMLATSNDVVLKDEWVGLEISHRAFADKNASGQWGTCSNNIDSLNPEFVGKKAGELAKKSINPKSIKAGKYKVLLGPMIFANLVWEFGESASAFNVDSGFSFLIDKINKKVTSEKFTLIDNPRLPNAIGVRRFDDEGIPVGITKIVEKGVLRTYLHNVRTAAKFKAKTTGNAGWISPMPWTLEVLPGDIQGEDEALEELGNGLYLTNSWYHRYQNYIKGDFSAILRDAAFYVENGEIKYPVIGGRLSDNMIKLFKNIINLTKDRYMIKWWEVQRPTLVPMAIIEGVNITKAMK